MNITKKISDLFEEGTFAFSDRIIGLFDEDLEVETDEDIDTILADAQV